MFDMKLFVDTDADTRLSRRVLRDIEHRGRDLEHVLHQYTTLVKPAFEEFCLPVRECAYPAGQFFPPIFATKNSRLFQSLKIRIILQVMVDSNQNERIFVYSSHPNKGNLQIKCTKGPSSLKLINTTYKKAQHLYFSIKQHS